MLDPLGAELEREFGGGVGVVEPAKRLQQLLDPPLRFRPAPHRRRQEIEAVAQLLQRLAEPVQRVRLAGAGTSAALGRLARQRLDQVRGEPLDRPVEPDAADQPGPPFGFFGPGGERQSEPGEGRGRRRLGRLGEASSRRRWAACAIIRPQSGVCRCANTSGSRSSQNTLQSRASPTRRPSARNSRIERRQRFAGARSGANSRSAERRRRTPTRN